MRAPRSVQSGSAALAIAEVRVRVFSDFPLLQIDNPSYQPFLCASPPLIETPPDIGIGVLVRPAPTTDSPVLFGEGDVWRLQAEPTGYRLSFYRMGEQRPHTVARANADTTCVRVHLDREVLLGQPRAKMLRNPVRYPLDQLLLMNYLASRGGVIAHAAGAVLQEKVVVLLGRSGAGKSTVSRLLVAAGLGEAILSDDRVIVRTERDGTGSAGDDGPARAEVWGTPWPGDAGIARNAGAPLGGLFFLVQAGETALTRLDAGAAMRRLVPVVSAPWYDRERGGQVMATCARLVEDFPCFDLHFRLHEEVVELIAGGSWNRNDRG
jgi:hypothetical protein